MPFTAADSEVPQGAPLEGVIEKAETGCYCADAKMAVALAATALPFARSHYEEAERWVRVLRLNGAVGNAMQAIGVPEEPLAAVTWAGASHPRRPDALAAVITAASANATARQARAIATEDLLIGVSVAYGEAFDQALSIRGTTSAEIVERVEASRVGDSGHPTRSAPAL